MVCSLLKTSLADHFGATVDVTTRNQRCVVRLPLKTADNRIVSIIVEEPYQGFFWVHDGGKTASQLFCQGVNTTKYRTSLREDTARKYGVEFSNRIIQKTCSEKDLSAAIVSVAQCAALLSAEVLREQPEEAKESISGYVARTLAQWKPDYIRAIERRVPVQGRVESHVFDFVSFPSDGAYSTVALKILVPDRPALQARRYGFLALDVEFNEMAKRWHRLAIIADASLWTRPSLSIIQKLSDDVLMFKSSEYPSVMKLLPDRMSALSGRAA